MRGGDLSNICCIVYLVGVDFLTFGKGKSQSYKQFVRDWMGVTQKPIMYGLSMANPQTADTPPAKFCHSSHHYLSDEFVAIHGDHYSGVPKVLHFYQSDEIYETRMRYKKLLCENFEFMNIF